MDRSWRLAPCDLLSECETVVLPYMVKTPRDMKAQRKVRRQGKLAEIREKPRCTSCHATTGEMEMLLPPPWRKLKYETVVAMENAMTISRNMYTNITIRFFEALSWFLLMNQMGMARIISSVRQSQTVMTAQRAVYQYD